MLSVTRMCGAVVAAGMFATPAMAVTTLDFNTLGHGEIVNSQFIASHNVAISGINRSSGPNFVVGFNTTRTGTADPDLQGPFSSGNLAGQAMGTLLIIEENDFDVDGNGFVNRPDDEGDRPAGSIYLDFLDGPKTKLGFDLVDVEGGHEFTASRGYVAFWLNNVEVARIGFGSFANNASPWYINDVDYGDHSANRIAPLTATELKIAGFDRVEFNMGGSGGIDNVKFNAVPEPVTAALTAISAGALLLNMRRRRTGIED